MGRPRPRRPRRRLSRAARILPPPFGPDVNAPQPARLFFPTGLVFAPSRHLLVVNGNFDRSFDFGSVSALDPAWLDAIFARPPGDPSDLSLPVPEVIPPAAFTGNAIIGNYAGPIALNPAGTIAITGSRNTNVVNGVQLDPATGKLSCVGAGGVDCRNGLIDLTPVNLEGPYGVAQGFARLPGTAVDVPVLFVSSLQPHIDEITNNVLYSRGRVAALDASDPTKVVFAADTSTTNLAGGIGGGPLVFSAARRQVIHAGCYRRYPSLSTGVPSTSKCGGTNTSNLVRFIGVDEGNDATVRLIDISADVRSNDTTDLALGNEDPVTGAPRTLYATVRSPDLIVEIELPADPTVQPHVRRATSLPISPAGLLRLARPSDKPGPDLIAVTAAGSGTLDIYDTTASQVVARIERLGTSPYAIAQLPPQPGDTSAKLAVSVFGECRVALVEVVYAQPWRSRLVARLGSCP